MKTYKEYYDEWELSTESRDLAFDEWLMLQLDRQRQQLIDKVCSDNVITSIGKAMLDPTISCKTKAELVRVILTKAMEE